MKKVKACLINPPTRSLSLRPPLGLMYISSYLSKHNIDNHVIDQKGDIPEDILIDRLVQKTVGVDPDHVGISCLTTDVPCVFKMVKKIKAELPHAKITVGGVHPTMFPDQMLADVNIDYVVLGEGEEVFCDIVCSDESMDFHSLTGIAFKDEGKIVINARRASIANLDDLPMPAFDKIDMSFYLQPNMHLVRGIPLRGFYFFSTRGCPYGCRFCVSKNVFGRTIRFREPSKVVDEIEYVYKKYNIDAFYLFDDTFGVKKSQAIDLCDAIAKRGLPIVWGCETRVNLINEEFVKSLKKAGCIQVDFGIESGSERLLKLLQKGIIVDQVRKAVKICRKYGVRVFSNFMINLPTETEEDVEDTLALADEIKSDISIFNVTCPFPGTELHSYLRHKLTTDDYTKMSSYVSYRTYIDFLESKCKLSAHNIPIDDMLARIQETVPVPRNIRLKFNMKYMRNFIRYFNFITNLKYIVCMVKSRGKADYIKFAFGIVRKRNISPTKL